MASWKRARAADRDAAVDLINAAYADGQLGSAERDDKVSRALVARTLGEVAQTTADLQGPAGSVPATSTPSGSTTATAAPSRPGLRDRWHAASRRTKAGVVAVALVLTGVGGVAWFGVPAEQTAVQVEQRPTVEVDAALVVALLEEYEESFGTTRSYGVIAHPEWVRVHVPTEDGRGRYTEWTLESEDPLELERSGEPLGAGDHLPIDLADLDTDGLERSIARARTSLGVEDPGDVRVQIGHWDFNDEPRITINVENEFSEDGYLVTDLAGELLEEHPFQTG